MRAMDIDMETSDRFFPLLFQILEEMQIAKSILNYVKTGFSNQIWIMGKSLTERRLFAFAFRLWLH